MSKKRVADNYLTHDNWDHEADKDDNEEPPTGPFQAAPDKVLAKRSIKKAARRIKPGDKKTSAPANPFGGFGGFGGGAAAGGSTATTTAEKPAFSFAPKDSATKGAFAGFSFKLGATSEADTKAPEVVSKVEPSVTATSDPATSENVSEKKPDDYFVRLASLNVSVLKWIEQHVEENSCVMLTPVFADYEKHLKALGAPS